MRHVRASHGVPIAFMKRQTNQRKAIVRVLDEAEQALSVEDVLERGRNLVASLNRATVYRNLRALTDGGMARRIVHPELGTLYEREGKPHHHHFHCRRCDRLFEVAGCALDVSGSAPAGFHTESHEVFLYGTCPACSKR